MLADTLRQKLQEIQSARSGGANSNENVFLVQSQYY